MTLELPKSNNDLWKKLGLTFAAWADTAFLYGVGHLGTDVYRVVLDAAGQKNPPLDWDYPFHEQYINERSVLWINDPEKRRSFLPQVVLLSTQEDADETSISVELVPEDFTTPVPVEAGFEFYKRSADGSVKKQFFDGENARLTDWDPHLRKLVFQGSSYFDYLKTNLALDAPIPALGTLREHLAASGEIEPLPTSKLANSTGINALLFSNDGYMIFQKRNETVLIRPEELCPGFSGTVDKIDVVHTVGSGGRLENLDVLREMVEELGVKRGEVAERRLLGITRELVRGGTPEMFYSVDVDLPKDAILSRIAKDKEGDIKTIFFGPYASSRLDPTVAPKLPEHFWPLVETIRVEGGGPVSVPLLSNLALWYQGACPEQVGTGSISEALN